MIVIRGQRGCRSTASGLRTMVDAVAAQRPPGTPFDVIRFGHTDDAGDVALVEACARAGATWWIESSFPALTTIDDVRRGLREGPPRVTVAGRTSL